MSFVLKKSDFSLGRIRAALPVFFLLWSVCILFLVVVTLVIKLQLQKAEQRDVHSRLDYFLQQTTAFSHRLEILEHGNNIVFLQGLAFVRIVKGGEQVLFTESDKNQVNFQGMANLDPHRSGVWVEMGNLDKGGEWTIVSQTFLEPDVIVQAGKERGETHKIYDTIFFLSLIASVISFVVSFFLAVINVKQGMSPVRKAREAIVSILGDRQSTALLPDTNDGELGELYKQINGLLLHNRKLIDEMQSSLDSVAHDLRTPMTRLRSVAEYGLQADTDPVRLSESLSDCLEESERVLSMLKIMMSVAEAESGTMHLNKERFDMAQSIENAISLYEYVAEEKNIVVESDLESDVSIHGDKTRIIQVWANLLDNGLKYGLDGGYVHISSRTVGKKVCVVFKDNGMGISESEIERIWERLYRGDRSRSQQGLGLGLNYVRAVVEAHEGTVSVVSSLGKGARFEVMLGSEN